MLKCIRCLEYSWTKNNPLCTKCAGRVEIPSVSNLMLKALERLPKVTLDEIWRSINKRILAFEHYELIHHFNSERMFAEYLNLVKIQKRTGSPIDLDIVQDEHRWRSLNYALTYEGEPKRERPTQERRVEPYNDDDEWVEVDEITPTYLKNLTLENNDEDTKTVESNQGLGSSLSNNDNRIE